MEEKQIESKELVPGFLRPFIKFQLCFYNIIRPEIIKCSCGEEEEGNFLSLFSVSLEQYYPTESSGNALHLDSSIL